jgi:hypothetical protein
MALSLNSGGVSTTIFSPDDPVTTMQERFRWFLGLDDKQTGHLQAIMGTP